MSRAHEFEGVMSERGWHYHNLGELCDEHMRLFLESYRILRLCEQFRTLTARALNTLARERSQAGQLRGHLPWDYSRGHPLPEDLS